MTSPTARANAARRQPPEIAICTAVYAHCHPAFVASLFNTQQLCARHGIVSHWLMQYGSSLVYAARNDLAAIALGRPSVTHLLWIDADISWDPRDVLRLLAHDVDTVARLYPYKSDKISNPVDQFGFEPVGGERPNFNGRTGMVEIEYCGLGFTLTKRQVYERLASAYPESRITTPRPHGERAAAWAFNFFPTSFEAGRFVGEDAGFFRAWRTLGGEVWADLSIKLAHHGTYAYAADPMSMFQAGLSPTSAKEIAA